MDVRRLLSHAVRLLGWLGRRIAVTSAPSGGSPGASPEPARSKLGLALAGGGFRASLFHLGVLWRMAELDLLRYVEVLSTVSGGSVIGALYVLILKKYLDKKAVLSRDEYIAIVTEVHRTLVRGIRKDLRTRLFMNPLGILRVLLTQDSLGRRMARLYERYIYARVVSELLPRPWWQRFWRPGRVLLRQVRFAPGGKEPEGGLEAYNRKAVAEKGSAITSLILNATSLNSGAPFRLSSAEVGDPRLGFFRYDEIPALTKRKRLLQELAEAELTRALEATPGDTLDIGGDRYDRRTVSLALWWRRRDSPADGRPPQGWEPLFLQAWFPGRLPEAEFGPLRQAKLAAWYLRVGLNRTPPVDGGVPSARHLDCFFDTVGDLDEEMGQQLKAAATGNPPLCEQALDFVMELYYLRSAEAMSPRIRQDWDRLSLGEAVGASACFPPVFPPFRVLGFYDDLSVTRLGLTDGGVYDNLGVSTLLEERCSYIIASDTGGLFDIQRRASTGRLGMSGRIAGILMDDVGGLQRSELRERRRVSRAIDDVPARSEYLARLQAATGLAGLAYFHINSPPLPGSRLDLPLGPRPAESLARLRTDLDAFGEIEVAALVNHGYETADLYLRKYLGGSPYADPAHWQPAASPPIPLLASPSRIRRTLAAGRSRFFRALLLGAPVSWIVTLAAIGWIVWATWDIRLSVDDVIAWLSTTGLEWLDSLVPWFGPDWTYSPVGVGAAILVAIGLVALATAIWPRLIGRLGNRFPRATRKILFAVKWARSYAANLLWLLGGAPIFIAGIGAAIAWIAHLCYHLPFLSRTRNRAES